VRVLAARQYPDKGAALRAELQLKALPRAEKLAFFATADLTVCRAGNASS